MLRKLVSFIGGLLTFVILESIGVLLLARVVPDEVLAQGAWLPSCIAFLIASSASGLCIGWISRSKSWKPALLLFGFFAVWYAGLGVSVLRHWPLDAPSLLGVSLSVVSLAFVLPCGARIGEVLAARKMQEQKRLVGKLLALGLGAFVVLNLAGWGLTRLLAGYSLSETLGRMLAELKASGAPMSLSDAAPPLIPEEENAAILYGEAFHELEKWEQQEHLYYPSCREDAPPAEEPSQEELISFFDMSQRAYDLLKMGSERAKCRFPVNYEDENAAQFPHLQKLRQCARYLEARAVTKMREGRNEEAAETLRVLFGLSRALLDEPTSISFLVGSAVHAIAVEVLRETLREYHMTQHQLHELAEEIPWPDREGLLLKLLAGERGMGIRIFEDVRTGKMHMLDVLGVEGRHEQFDAFFQSAFGIRILARDEIFYLERMNELIRIAGQPYWKMRERIEEWDLKAESPPMLAVLSMTMLPSSRLVFTAARRRASESVALAALALLSYKVEEGDYPESLEELATEGDVTLFKDPFTGSQLNYERREEGFLVYSLGADGEDDGGSDDDISWTWND